MAISQKTLENMKKQLPEKWTIDMQGLIYYNEKNPCLRIFSDDKQTMTQYTLMYTERREGYKRLEGYNVKLNKSVWTKTTTDMWASNGLGTYVKIRENYSLKKNFKKLTELAKEYSTVEKLDGLINEIEHEDTSFGGILIN